MEPLVNLLPVAARDSPLSKAQVLEVEKELQAFYPHIRFVPTFLKTYGDLDRATSLRTLDKTDFFTKEVDVHLLNGHCRIAIHSAKDLPNPLSNGLQCIALTQGVDPADALVLRSGETLENLPKNSLIGASSKRREEAIKAMRPDLLFADIRGTIGERLEKVFQKELAGVVIALAALIRLNLTHLNWIKIPGETVPLQGRLAILAREGDEEMQVLFALLNSRFL